MKLWLYLEKAGDCYEDLLRSNGSVFENHEIERIPNLNAA